MTNEELLESAIMATKNNDEIMTAKLEFLAFKDVLNTYVKIEDAIHFDELNKEISAQLVDPYFEEGELDEYTHMRVFLSFKIFFYCLISDDINICMFRNQNIFSAYIDFMNPNGKTEEIVHGFIDEEQLFDFIKSKRFETMKKLYSDKFKNS